MTSCMNYIKCLRRVHNIWFQKHIIVEYTQLDFLDLVTRKQCVSSYVYRFINLMKLYNLNSHMIW